MRRAILLLAPIVLLSASHVFANDGDKSCKRVLAKASKAEMRELISRIGGQSRTQIASLKPMELEIVSYLDSLQLVEPLSEGIPMRNKKDIENAVNGKIDHARKVLRPLGVYPLESLAIDSAANWAALTVHRAMIPESRKNAEEGRVYLARINKQTSSLKHVTHIQAQDMLLSEPQFVNDGNRLVVSALSKKTHQQDLYLYDIAGGNSNLSLKLSDYLKVPISRIDPLDSPDSSRLFFSVEVDKSRILHQVGQENYFIVAINKLTGQVETLIRSSIPATTISKISFFQYQDDRRGYLVQTGENSVNLRSGYFEAQFTDNKLVLAQESSLEKRRSSQAAWLILYKDQTRQTDTLTVKNELSSEVYELNIKGLDYGVVAETQLGFVYVEKNHPHYGTYLLSENEAPKLISNTRLINFAIHDGLMVGTTVEQGQDTRIKIIPFGN